MYKRVLIPLDGSEAAEMAVEKILEIAPQVESVHLTVVENPVMNMARLDGYTMYADQIMSVRERSSFDYLRPFQEKLEAAGLRVDTSVVFGDPVPATAQKARETGADLVLLGGRQGGWFWRFTGLAGIAGRLGRRLDVPVVLSENLEAAAPGAGKDQQARPKAA